jgi:hypothetical protein
VTLAPSRRPGSGVRRGDRRLGGAAGLECCVPESCLRAGGDARQPWPRAGCPGRRTWIGVPRGARTFCAGFLQRIYGKCTSLVFVNPGHTGAGRVKGVLTRPVRPLFPLRRIMARRGASGARKRPSSWPGAGPRLGRHNVAMARHKSGRKGKRVWPTGPPPQSHRSHWRADGAPKTAYRSQRDALSAADERRQESGVDLNVYRCEICSAWHLGGAERHEA